MSSGGGLGLLNRRGLWIGAAAALLLGGGSTALAAAAGVGSHHSPVARIGCAAPALPGSVVQVTLTDMGGMMMRGAGRMAMTDSPGTVPAGTVSLRVVNVGMRVHEVLVLPLPAGQGVGQRVIGSDGRVDESASLGESSGTCAAGEGDGIAPGATGWVTLNLAPGRYELLCNIAGHYAAGAYTELDVS